MNEISFLKFPILLKLLEIFEDLLVVLVSAHDFDKIVFELESGAWQTIKVDILLLEAFLLLFWIQPKK